MSQSATELEGFLAQHGWAGAAREPVAGDASARRYERLSKPGAGGDSAILMLAPADASADAFVRVGELLAGMALSVPRVLARKRARGWLILEDFGDDDFAGLLDRGEAAGPLFDLAVDTLIALHQRFRPEDLGPLALPRYDATVFLDQLMLFGEQVLGAESSSREGGGATEALREAWEQTLPAAFQVPSSLLLRDYHGGNLMRLARPGIAACGLLDFQDAGIGPVTYDLASLIEDARRDLAPAPGLRARARYLASFPRLDAAP